MDDAGQELITVEAGYYSVHFCICLKVLIINSDNKD